MRDRWRAKLARNKQQNVEKPRAQRPERPLSLPTTLSRVDESSVSAMGPGDVFLVDELECAGPYSKPAFHAILACPLCGSQVLISAAQYFGFAPIICGSKTCPAFFRIIDDERFVYLPIN